MAMLPCSDETVTDRFDLPRTSPTGPGPGRIERGDLDNLLCEYAQSCVDRRACGLTSDVALSESWIRFYRALDPFVRASARPHPGRTVEPDDAVQEAWLALIAGLRLYGRGDGDGRFLAWALVVTRNRLANLERRAASRPETSLGPGAAVGLVGRDEDPAVACERDSTRESVRAVLEEARDHVPETSHRVIVLRWIEGRPVSEIAEALGLSAAQVRDRHRRTIPILRMLFERRLGPGTVGLEVDRPDPDPLAPHAGR